jgi:hypothetical protein
MLAFVQMRFPQRRLALLLAWGVWSAPLAAFAEPSPSLTEAIEQFKHLEDQRAAKLLTEFLTEQRSTAEAGLAHVYLGLIRLNALDDEGCLREFKTAMALDATLELPPKVSPKAKPLFAQAKKDVAPVAAPAPAVAAPPVVMLEGAPPSAGSSRVPAYATGIGAVVVAGVGIVLGVLSNSDYNSAVATNDLGNSNSLASRSGSEGLAADVCFAVAGVAAVTAVVLYFVERGSTRVPESTVVGGAGGMGVRF